MSTDTAGAGEAVPLSAAAIANTGALYQAGEVPARPDARVLAWAEAQARLAEARTYWLATTGPGGAPHVRPVLAVWADGGLFSTTSPAARKAGNLRSRPRCALTARTDGLDLVVEGTAARVTDAAWLQRVAYLAKYGWPVTVRDGAFDAPYGAPTSGPPPYEVYGITAAVVFGFGTDETFAPLSTRWRF
jgi:nitroimidazol reductase NimA-like FMN-containing flavoprotein (pyridoxamine 5'-phosphate oxidase superfamily)